MNSLVAEPVETYYDPRFHTPAVKLLPGEYRVDDREVMIVTILGSCVAACLYDASIGVGGMNHFMLPGAQDASRGGSGRYGAYAMEMLINEMMKRGASRERLQAKAFGGAAVLPGMTTSNVGAENARFVVDYLQTEGIALLASDLGALCPRRVHFFPSSGRAFVKRLPAAHRRAVATDEENYRRQLLRVPPAGTVELF